MPHLGSETLAGLPASVRRPVYDRTALAAGMAHIGVGAFHRCHQAEFTDDMLEARFGRWGVVGVNLKPPRLAETLGRQDGLYSRTLRHGAAAETRVIGCIRRTVDAAEDAAAATAVLADPAIAVATLTITEKGYCHIPSTGGLDLAHPEVTADLAADLAGTHAPRTVLGLLAAGLERRRLAGAGGITLVSCDNIPSNGAILRRVLTDFAGRAHAPLARWIEAEVRFPSTMVDRIVPATAPEDFVHAAAVLGVEDLAPVVGEPFRQWVIEDDFAGPRPDWDLAGAEFVRDVHPHELIKMRLLNGVQSTLSYWGALSGLAYTYEAAADPVLGGLARRMVETESATTVPAVAGMESGRYIAEVFERVTNTAIRHRNHQVATDGSQKIVQRLINPIRDRIAAGRGFDLLAAAVAGWMAYLLAAAPRFGARWQASDPFAGEVAAIAARGGGSGELARAIAGIVPIFGTDLADGPFVPAVTGHLDGLLSAAPRAHLRRLLAAAPA